MGDFFGAQRLGILGLGLTPAGRAVAATVGRGAHHPGPEHRSEVFQVAEEGRDAICRYPSHPLGLVQEVG